MALGEFVDGYARVGRANIRFWDSLLKFRFSPRRILPGNGMRWTRPTTLAGACNWSREQPHVLM